MQKTDLTHMQSDEESPRSGGIFRLYLLQWPVLVALLLLAIVPPLIIVNRLQRRIVPSISPHSAASRPQIGDTLTLASVETSTQ
ncbi:MULTISPECIES: hypothetical protein [Acidobacteriaceae]|uniref:hypothetical protein n=1 Tax=Acidobacteriaceae TaxID=204434 RepID=UPI00131E4FEB|nr:MULTISPECIES: hypothetical protein [Acidobacteriaceae]MDW5264619.1 hypothetical protein [Edaphobacter sp.]